MYCDIFNNTLEENGWMEHFKATKSQRQKKKLIPQEKLIHKTVQIDSK